MSAPTADGEGMTFEELARLTARRSSPDAPIVQEAGAPLPRRSAVKAVAKEDSSQEPITRGPRGIGTILPGLGWAIGS